MRNRGYDMRGGGMLETIVQDLKYAFRQLRKQPSFSIVAIVTLALGIGVSTALFSVIDTALLRPLPYPNPEELVTLSVEEPDPSGRRARYDPSMTDIRRWRELTTVVAHAGMGRISRAHPPSHACSQAFRPTRLQWRWTRSRPRAARRPHPLER
jgi:hypothetical protein